MPFQTYLDLVLKRPRAVIAALMVMTLVMAWFCQYFRLDASSDSLVKEGDADLEFSREMNARYGARDFLFITYAAHGDLFTPHYLDLLRQLRDDLAGLERVDSINSILDVPLFEVSGSSLGNISTDSLLTLNSAGVDLNAARADLAGNEAYSDVLLSTNGNTTALIVNFARNTELQLLLDRRTELQRLSAVQQLTPVQREELDAVIQQYESQNRIASENLHTDITTTRNILNAYRDEADIAMGGVPMIADDLVTFVRNDLINFGSVMLIFIVLTLSYLFRKVRYVILPMLCCAVTTVTVVGMLGLFGWPVTVISSNFISLLLIITISLNVHLMVRYLELEAAAPQESHLVRLSNTLQSMLKPCAYTSLTTIVAFGSLVVSDIPPIIDFGWMMVLGVCTAFSITFLLLPAILSLLNESLSAKQSNSIELTPALARLTDNHGNKVVVLSVILLVFSVLGMYRLTVENSFINYFDENTDIYQGMVEIDRNMGGTTPLDIIIDMSRPNPFDNGEAGADEDEFADEDFFWEEEETPETDNAYWFTSDKMEEVTAIHAYLDNLPQTGKVLSLATLLNIAYELNDSEPLNSIELAILYNRIPDEYREALLTPYVSVENDQTRFSIRVRETDPDLVRADLLATIRDGLVEEFGFLPEQIHLTGMLVLYNNMLQSLFDSQILTLALVLGMILLMFIILFRSAKLALIGILPNILAATTVLGIMGWFNIPLDMMTITIAAISVGIGVDNTIHYIHRFQTNFPQHHGNYKETMHSCHASIGRAMYYTGFTIVAGFSILVLSNFIPTIYFGLLTSLAMILALAGALTLLPQLLILFRPLRRIADRPSR